MSNDKRHPHDDPRYAVHKTEAEWRAALSPAQFAVARQAATERAFTGQYWNHWDKDGHYRCVACGEVLFSADSKFDAGCGWPSYWQAVDDGRVERVEDRTHGMLRVEVRCAKCGSHLGHVFDDGPEPTGERFCINSAAIHFAPDADAVGPNNP
ncbi:MAG: peptide-methionine (R)-S-oxide reductase MsrB [Vitreoscilla sp.]|nr:peptide-methionine (R)-S-oxide reductase MsrB [Burkholderiales bacterium]MBP6336726.1 peptide-methionine (R)-S-oxide reductase MsrB [Vitreoscilla sp.]MBP6674492.1 peptide-methionine (R)-S-oxide reductase MsrB [Vitreoscilla sp.]